MELGSEEANGNVPGTGRERERHWCVPGDCTGSSVLRILRVEILGEVLGEDVNRKSSSFPGVSFQDLGFS